MLLSVPYLRQEHRHTCGLACLRMALHHFGGKQSEAEIAAVARLSPLLGMTSRAIAEAANALGHTACLRESLTWDDVEQSLRGGCPVVALVDPAKLYLGLVGLSGHFVLIVGMDGHEVVFHDPDLSPDIRRDRGTVESAWAESGFEGVVFHGTNRASESEGPHASMA